MLWEVLGVSKRCLIVQPPLSSKNVGNARPCNEGGRRVGVGVGAREEEGVGIGEGEDLLVLLVVDPPLPRRALRRMVVVVLVGVVVDFVVLGLALVALALVALALVGVLRFSRVVVVFFLGGAIFQVVCGRMMKDCTV